MKLIARCSALVLLAALAVADAAKPPLSQPSGTPRDFLPVDEAFELQPAEWRRGKLVVSWRIAPGYFLYRERLKFLAQEPAGLKLGAAALPDGERYVDEVFGPVEIYKTELRAELPATPAGALTLKVTYQGCAEAGLCYPPQTRTLQADPPPR